jgi:Signal transduction histidine kinase
VLNSRWWLAALAVVTIACAVIIAAGAAELSRWWIAAAALAVFVVVFLTLGRRVHQGGVGAVAIVAVSILTTFALASTEPSLAVFQSIAMPAGWVLSRTRRGGILASLGIGLATGAGFLVSISPFENALVSALITFAFSFGGSVAIGLWIWRIGAYGDERARLLDELMAAQDELATLHRDAGVTAERERLARELHDTIAQSLAGLVLVAQRSRRELAAGKLTDETLALLEEGAREALTETRTLVAGSAPVELGSGLAGALEVLAERFRRESGVSVSVSVELDAPLDRDAEVVLLRCAQEGLANVRKHAKATRVAVSLAEAEGGVELRVADDGRGLDPTAIPDGFGLSGLRARLDLAGGTLDVASDGGTTITARLPRAEVAG